METISEEAAEIFDHSCLINVLSSYLRNDSGKFTDYIPLSLKHLKLKL